MLRSNIDREKWYEYVVKGFVIYKKTVDSE